MRIQKRGGLGGRSESEKGERSGGGLTREARGAEEKGENT